MRMHPLKTIRFQLLAAMLLLAVVPLLVVAISSLVALEGASATAIEQSEMAMVAREEAAILDVARSTARRIETYVVQHPELLRMDLAQLQGDAGLAEIAVQPVGQTGYTTVFDENGITLFHADPAMVGADLSTLAGELPEFWSVFGAALDGSPADGYYRWQDSDGAVHATYASIVPVDGSPLRVAATSPIDEFSRPVAAIGAQLNTIWRQTHVRLIVTIAAVATAVVAGASLYGWHLARSIKQVTTAVVRMADGDLRPTGLHERGDEIGVWARALDRMAVRLQETSVRLEGTVTERTRAIASAAEIGRSLMAKRDLDGLLVKAVESIRSSFDLCQVQIYLPDPTGSNLVLRASTGEVGAELVHRRHSLAIGPGSINGVAAAEKQTIVVENAARSAAFLSNPVMPDTCSEIAVPLLVGERIVGVLDLQSARTGSVANQPLPAFEALAGQLAVAIENAALFAEAAGARDEMEAQIQRWAREDWQGLFDGVERSEWIGYTCEDNSLRPLARPLAQTDAPHVLTIPIQVQGMPVGAIQVEGEPDRSWTDVEANLTVSIARQVAQQAENLHFLAQANRYRARAEQANSLLTRKGWRAYLDGQIVPGAGFYYDRHEVKPLAKDAEAGEPVLTQELQVRGETIGKLSIGGVEALDGGATDLVTAVTERLSLHIENLRLLEETMRRERELAARSRELEASQRVTFAASEAVDPDELLDLVVNLIRDQFDLYHAQVYLTDKEQRTAVLHKSTGYAGHQLLEQGHFIPLERETLVAKAIRLGSPMVVNDVSREENWVANPLLPHTCSELVVPLKVGDRVLGALDVQSRDLDTFTPATVALFQTMAEQVAMSFRSADLLARTREQASILARFTTQLQTAAEVAERVSTILDPAQLLGEVVEHLQSRFGLYHAHVYLLQEPARESAPDGSDGGAGETQERWLILQAGSGKVGGMLQEQGYGIPMQDSHSLVARAVREQRLVLVDDTDLEPDFVPNPLLPETRSEAAVPLIAGDVTLGVLDVQDNQPRRFTQADQNVLTTLAGQIATALQNARLFEEIQQAAERLRELDHLKSEFLANMSHELRTPLNSIIGYAELIMVDLVDQLDSETLEDIQAIHLNGVHLLHIINDILDLAKIEAGQLKLKIEEVQIEPLLEKVKTSTAGLLVNKPVEMKVEIDQALPPIEADSLRINQILNNLVSNAVKFTESGCITLRASCEDGWVHVEVEDTGIGINQSKIETIFERFRQADGSYTRRAEGTGLGLSITRHLAEMHGGEVSVQSQPGEGSTFTVTLPVQFPVHSVTGEPEPTPVR